MYTRVQSTYIHVLHTHVIHTYIRNIRIYTYIHTHTHSHTHTRVYIRMYVYIYTFTYMFTYACMYIGYLDALQLLIDAGAEVDARNMYQCTPLHYACHWGHWEASNSEKFPT